MATFIWRGTWTAKGMEKINDLPQRYETAQNAFKSAGAELKDLSAPDWQNRKQCLRSTSQKRSIS
ncbi:MAG: hypothetical protein ABSB81_00865 [Halobacteriota archaeon]|jgi:uncharacterized protein with GYD domain